MIEVANSESAAGRGAIARQSVELQSTWEFVPRADVDALRVKVRADDEAADICISDRSNEYACLEADLADLEDFRSLLRAIVDGRAALSVTRLLGGIWLRAIRWPGGVWTLPVSPIMVLLPQRVVSYEPYAQTG